MYAQKLFQLFKKRERELIEPRTIVLDFKDNGGSLKAYYKIIDIDGKTIEIPAKNQLDATIYGLFNSNFYVLTAKDRLIVLYGDEHVCQMFRSKESYQKMIEYFERQSKVKFNLVVVEHGSKTYMNERKLVDFPENAEEKFKNWIRELDKKMKIEVSPLTYGTLFWRIDTSAENEMYSVRRNMGAVFKTIKLVGESPLLVIYGGSHVPDLIDILYTLGYRIVKRKRIEYKKFMTHEEKISADLLRSSILSSLQQK